jgi:hypothetical protein
MGRERARMPSSQSASRRLLRSTERQQRRIACQCQRVHVAHPADAATHARRRAASAGCGSNWRKQCCAPLPSSRAAGAMARPCSLRNTLASCITCCVAKEERSAVMRGAARLQRCAAAAIGCSVALAQPSFSQRRPQPGAACHAHRCDTHTAHRSTSALVPAASTSVHTTEVGSAGHSRHASERKHATHPSPLHSAQPGSIVRHCSTLRAARRLSRRARARRRPRPAWRPRAHAPATAPSTTV